ncbi:hypothetical protein MRB53_021805 [Persea americana]|uniref:Uncharacterized protein n=1 Tax=Persea americana TaxID=3435 RepID=A0ACC2L629_PERAE|nr:hypothetical protein MRB53_021805 [Persea americana]
MVGNKIEEQALKVSSEEKSGTRGRGVFQGRGRGRGRQQFNRAIVECYNCHKLGHFQYECPSWEKNVNYAEHDGDQELLLMSYVEMHNSKREEVWFLDSGCSNHMSGDKRWFLELDETFRHVVKLGNNTKMDVMGRGNIRLHAHGATQIYHPVKGLIMQTIMSANRMFALLASVPTHALGLACFQMTSEDTTHLWHRRFGHLSLKGLRTLAYKKLVTGLPPLNASSKLCTDCVIGKQHQDSIPKKKEEKWNWGKSVKEIRCDTLEWGDEEDGEETEEEDNEEEEQVEQPAEGGISGSGSGLSSSSEAAAENVASTPLNTPSHAQGRIRREPAWTGEYVIGEGNDEKMFEEFKGSMKREFDMSDIGRMKYFLGVEIVQSSDGIFISQKNLYSFQANPTVQIRPSEPISTVRSRSRDEGRRDHELRWARSPPGPGGRKPQSRRRRCPDKDRGNSSKPGRYVTEKGIVSVGKNVTRRTVGDEVGAEGNFVFIKDAVYKKPDISLLPFPTHFIPSAEDTSELEPLVADLGEIDPFMTAD